MNLKKKWLEKSVLYVILDKEILGNKSVSGFAGKIKSSGVSIIQLRDKISARGAILKEAQNLRKTLAKDKIIFLVNDYLEIAKIAASGGIHLGQYDTSVKTAREILGKSKIIGISCHSLKQALNAQKSGADYISLGPVFPTPLKSKTKTMGLSSLEKIAKKVKLPCFAIGGINENNLKEVLRAGIKRVVVCRAACKSPHPERTIKNLIRQLKTENKK